MLVDGDGDGSSCMVRLHSLRVVKNNRLLAPS